MKFQYLVPGLFAALAVAQDKSQITIDSFSASGSGCPQGSVSSSISSDRTVITFGFDSFQAYIGPGTSPSDHTKNCELHLTVHYPAGFSFAIVDATYHGYAQLDQGVTASFLSSYFYSQDASKTTTTRTNLQGGGVWSGGQVYTKDDTAPSNVVRSPCGTSAILNVDNRIALTSSDSNASGQVTDDDATVAMTHQIHIQWFSC